MGGACPELSREEFLEKARVKSSASEIEVTAAVQSGLRIGEKNEK